MSSQLEAQQPKARRGGKYYLLTGLQVVIGLGLGWWIADLKHWPEELVALIGTGITFATWLADEVFTLPSKKTRWGRIAHETLRILSLLGLLIALASLTSMNGLSFR